MKGLIALFLFVTTFSFAQSKIFRGEIPNPHDAVYVFDNQGVKRLNSALWPSQLYYFRGNKVFADKYMGECLYTINDNKIYRGDSNSFFDLLYEYENGSFFQVSSNSLKKCLFTLHNNKIYVGDSKSTFDCIFSVQFDASVNNNELYLFLCLAPY